MAGSGKSVIGRRLARSLGYSCIDIDTIIESAQNERLAILVGKLGDKGFLDLEERTICDLQVKDNTIISTGGSAIYSERAMNHLKSFSKMVYLDTPYIDIVRRVGNKPRGIIGLNNSDLKGVFEERASLYEKYADITIDCSHSTISRVLDRVMYNIKS